MRNKLTMAFCLTLIASAAHAQSPNIQTDKIQWNATGFTDLISNAAANNSACQFITNGTQSIDWVQGDGSFVTTFSVTSSSGVWSDLSADGSVTIGLSSGALTGELILSRNAQSLSAVLIVNGGTVAIKNSYTVSSLQKL